MDRAIASALVLWHRFTITRYLAASIIALAFDVALFSSLVAVGSDPTIASAAGKPDIAFLDFFVEVEWEALACPALVGHVYVRQAIPHYRRELVTVA